MSTQITLTLHYTADPAAASPIPDDCRWLTAGLLAMRIPEDLSADRLATQVSLIERIPPIWMRRALSIRYAGELIEDGVRWGLLMLEMDQSSSRLAAAEAVCEYVLSRRNPAYGDLPERLRELLENWQDLRRQL